MLQMLRVRMNWRIDRKYLCKRNPITVKHKDSNSGSGKHWAGNCWKHRNIPREAPLFGCSSLSACFRHLPETGHWDLLGLFSVSICSSKAALQRVIIPHEVLSHLHGNRKKAAKYYSYIIKRLNKHLPGIKCFGSFLRTRQWAEWLAEVSFSIRF